jgi:hypothetical protein
LVLHDGSRLLQYGLIAEEVAKIYPDLVEYDEIGQPFDCPVSLRECDAAQRGLEAMVGALQDLLTRTTPPPAAP